MAKIVYFRDDFDGTTVDDTVATRSVKLEEGTLTIDMSADNYGLLMDALQPFIDKGEWTARETGNDENTVIREWARKNGHDVSARGRLSKDVTDAYREYLKSTQAPTQTPSDGNVEPNPDTADGLDAESDADNGSRELANSSA